MATQKTTQQNQTDQKSQVAEESKEKEKSWLDSAQDWMSRNLGIAGTVLGKATFGVAKVAKNLVTGNFSEVFSKDSLTSLLSLGTIAGGVYGISAIRKSDKSMGNTVMWGLGGLAVLSALSSYMSNNDNDKDKNQAQQSTGSASKALAKVGENITSAPIGNGIGSIVQGVGKFIGLG